MATSHNGFMPPLGQVALCTPPLLLGGFLEAAGSLSWLPLCYSFHSPPTNAHSRLPDFMDPASEVCKRCIKPNSFLDQD